MPSQTPILEVSHLPSASSFYAAITQPLGLQYLCASSPSSPIACLHYGTVTETGKNIVFSIAQAPASRPIPSNICLTAPSTKGLVDFHKKSEFLNQGKQSIERIEDQGTEYLVAECRDLDGNMIQAAHTSRAPSQRAPSMAGESQAGSRVLDWQEDVARSVISGDGRSQVSSSTVTRGPPGTSFHRSNTAPTMSSRTLERQTITTESYRRQHPELARSVSQGAVPVVAEKGISSKAVIGTLLGAAAGAVFAYAMVRSESPEPAAVPMPVPEAPIRGVSYVHGTSPGRAPSMAESYHREHNVVERIPARSFVSEREGSSQADVRPRYVERYSVVGGGERGLERIDEGSYISGSGYSKAMTTRPLEIMPVGSQVSTGSKRSSSGSKHHSHHSSHHSAHESVVSGSRAPSHRDDTSYHSARSSRTESTVVPSPSKAHSNYVTAAPSKVGSSTTTIKLSPSKVGSKAGSVRPTRVESPRSAVDGSRAAGSRSGGSRSGGSRVSGSKTGSVRASQVELPQSVVDADGYEGYEYEASVAPSDSVSSVGSKMERLRLVGRMGRFTG